MVKNSTYRPTNAGIAQEIINALYWFNEEPKKGIQTDRAEIYFGTDEGGELVLVFEFMHSTNTIFYLSLTGPESEENLITEERLEEIKKHIPRVKDLTFYLFENEITPEQIFN